MSAPRSGRRLAAIMFADVVGFSSLVGRDEEGTLARLRSLRRTIIDPAVEDAGGRVVKAMGDGFLIEYPSAVDAVRSAISVQRALAALPTSEHEDSLQLRIGVNLGDVVVEGDDLLGDGVNIAARLQSLAQPGMICISGKVREEIVGRIDLPLTDMGPRNIKNIANPVRVYSIELDAPPVVQDDRTRMEERPEPPPSPRPAGRAAKPLAPGDLINNTYRIERLIGAGSMGAVYRAQNVFTNEPNAVKVILEEHLSSPQVVELFQREAMVVRRVRHAAVVGYEGVFLDADGRVYLVMEYVDGLPLSQVIEKQALTVAQTLALAERVLTGLEAAHNTGAVHRDLSHNNILLPDGRVEKAKIIDFGIAKGGDTGKTIIGSQFAGTYSFASPEQTGLYGGVVDQRSDLYSLGLVLAAAARGRALPMGTSMATVIEHRRTVPDLSSLPIELRDYLSKLLQPNPADRPQSARAAIELLPQLAPAAPKAKPQPKHKPEARDATVKDSPPPPPPAPLLWIAAAAVAGLLVLGGGAYCLTGGAYCPGGGATGVNVPLPEAVQAVLAEFPNARLGANIAGETVAVVGHLRDTSDLDRLNAKLRALPTIKIAALQAVRLLDERRSSYLAQLESAGAVLSVKHGQGAVGVGQPPPLAKQFKVGAMLNVEIPARSDFRFHYVTLLGTDERALHMLPTAALRDNWVDERLLRGLADKYHAAEPVGMNLLLDVSSSAALSIAPPAPGTAVDYYSDYMRRLIAAVRAAPRGTVEYSYVLLETTPR